MMDGYSAWRSPPARCPAIGRKCIGLPCWGPGQRLHRLPFQFFFDLCLGPAQDIFVDGFASFWITACGIPSFPAAIFSLADVSLAVRSSFCHVRHLLLDYPHYHTLAGIATGRQESYQKIFISCCSESRFYSYISSALQRGQRPANRPYPRLEPSKILERWAVPAMRCQT